MNSIESDLVKHYCLMSFFCIQPIWTLETICITFVFIWNECKASHSFVNLHHFNKAFSLLWICTERNELWVASVTGLQLSSFIIDHISPQKDEEFLTFPHVNSNLFSIEKWSSLGNYYIVHCKQFKDYVFNNAHKLRQFLPVIIHFFVSLMEDWSSWSSVNMNIVKASSVLEINDFVYFTA